MLRVYSFCTLLLLSSALGNNGCKSRDVSAELTDGSELPLLLPAQEAPRSSVRLLEAPDRDDLPHLMRHEGEMLIEQDRRQYLFAGLAPLSESSFSLRVPSAVYLRTGQGWKPLRFLPPIDLSLSHRPGQYLQVTSQFAQEGKHGPELRTLWRLPHNPTWQAEVTIRPLAKTTGFMLETRAPEGQKLSWSVRIARGFGEEFPVPYEGKLYSGVSLALLPDTISLISAHPLRLESQATSSQLSLNEPQAHSGFYLTMGRPAALQQPSLISRAQNCLRDEPSEAMSCFIRGEKAPQTLRRLTLDAGVKGRGERQLAQNVFLQTVTGDFRSAFSIFEGETLVLQQDEPLKLLVANAEGMWKSIALPLDRDGAQLPPLEKGSLQIKLEEQVPAFLEIRDAQYPSAISWQLWTDKASSDKNWLSPYAALQTSWPLELNLPAGDYKVKIFTGTTTLCQQDLTIRPGKLSPLTCPAKEQSLRLPERRTFASSPLTSFADLFAAAKLRAIPTEGSGQNSRTDILAYREETLGLGLRAFPVRADIVAAWNRYVSPTTRLKDFAQFLRDKDPDIQILLECPPSGFSQADYEWLALQIQPNLIEMYGCPQMPSSLAWLQFAQRLQQQLKHPLKFATTIPRAPWTGWGSMLPAIFLPEAKPESPEQHDLADILNGQYSLGLRSEIQVLARTSKQVTLRIRSDDTQFAALVLQIADQQGALSHHPITWEPSIDRELTLPLATTPNSRWLRLSLFGISRNVRTQNDRQEAPRADTSIFLLATSNFMDIDGVLAQKN